MDLLRLMQRPQGRGEPSAPQRMLVPVGKSLRDDRRLVVEPQPHKRQPHPGHLDQGNVRLVRAAESGESDRKAGRPTERGKQRSQDVGRQRLVTSSFNLLTSYFSSKTCRRCRLPGWRGNILCGHQLEGPEQWRQIDHGIGGRS